MVLILDDNVGVQPVIRQDSCQGQSLAMLIYSLENQRKGIADVSVSLLFWL